MRLTRCLLRWDPKRKHFEYLWRTRAKKKDLKLVAPAFLHERGIDIKPLPSLKETVHEHFEPPPGDVRFWRQPPIEECKNYHEESIYVHHMGIRLMEGIKQAQNLTKTVVLDGLPPAVEKLIDKVEIPDQEKLIQRLIMQSQVWDTLKVKLPRRIDKEKVSFRFSAEYGIPYQKSVEILTNSFVRSCHNAICTRYISALLDRRLIYRPSLQTYLPYKGKTINFKSTFEFLISSHEPLATFTDMTAVSQSADTVVPSMFPVLPTIDLKNSNLYTLQDNTGFQGDYKYSHPHTFVYCNNNQYWRDTERQAQAILMCFAYTVVQAKARFGDDVKVLPEPISIQCINIGETAINFVCFQLNTTDIDSDEGVKNFAWLDTNNVMFKKHLPKPWKERRPVDMSAKRDSFDSTAFRKMMAVMLNGVALE